MKAFSYLRKKRAALCFSFPYLSLRHRFFMKFRGLKALGNRRHKPIVCPTLAPYYAGEFKRRAMPASIRRGAKRAPQIIHRLRPPAMISVLPAIMAS